MLNSMRESGIKVVHTEVTEHKKVRLLEGALCVQWLSSTENAITSNNSALHSCVKKSHSTQNNCQGASALRSNTLEGENF